jgi:hypothetical protein
MDRSLASGKSRNLAILPEESIINGRIRVSIHGGKGAPGRKAIYVDAAAASRGKDRDSADGTMPQ